MTIKISIEDLIAFEPENIGNYEEFRLLVDAYFGEKNFIIKVAILKKCPDLIQDCYVGASPEALIFWLVDGSIHGRSLAEVREKLISGVE